MLLHHNWNLKKNVISLKLRIEEQNVVSLKLKPEEQNVAPSKLRIDELSNLCELELTMVTVCNSNVEIIFNTNWEFQSKNGGLDCFRIYVH